ncbi:MAG: MBL fold metallo-hydrolase [Myxococcota bacterium]
MRFTVLGSGTTFPDVERGPAGFLVQVGTDAYLVDGGSGTLQRCMRAGVDPRGLAGGFYSHWHPDHMADLVPLLFTFRVADRKAPYPIHAGAGFHDVLDGLEQTFGRWVKFGSRGASVHELSTRGPDVVQLGGLTVRSRPANHGAGALHYRFEADGVAVVYSGDTGPSDNLVELARGADLLVCECAGSDAEPIEGHMTPTSVMNVVRAARPRETWLTHLYPHVSSEEAVGRVSSAGPSCRHASDLDVWDSAQTRRF